MAITQLQKQEFVTKIRESVTFKNAPTSSAMLQYLHEAGFKKTNLKESVIEIEFFGNKEVLGKSNPRVRVNVFNLRKKLTSYYKGEGKDDNWILSIKKGQYHISFDKKQNNVSRLKNIKWIQILPYFALAITLGILIKTLVPIQKPDLWKEFLKTQSETNLFIGDHFGLIGKTITGEIGWTRDFNINSVNDFYDVVDKKPEMQGVLKPSTYGYSTRMSALATQHLQELFQTHNSKFDIRFSTQASVPEIKEGNAIYAGPFKNKNLFIHLFNEANPYFKISKDKLIVSNSTKQKDTIILLKSNRVDEEYALVSKYPSLGNSEHFTFFSDHDIGVSATVEYFTNKDSIKAFEDKYLKGNKHFTALFKVKGQNRTNTSLKLEMVVSF